jgi:hypothetical protein
VSLWGPLISTTSVTVIGNPCLGSVITLWVTAPHSTNGNEGPSWDLKVTVKVCSQNEDASTTVALISGLTSLASPAWLELCDDVSG